MTHYERVTELVKNGYTAANDPTHGLVVLFNGIVRAVAGGSFASPSLRGLPNAQPASIQWTRPS